MGTGSGDAQGGGAIGELHCRFDGLVFGEGDGERGVEGVPGGGGVDGFDLRGGGVVGGSAVGKEGALRAEFEDDLSCAYRVEGFGGFVWVVGVAVREERGFGFVGGEVVSEFENLLGEWLRGGGVEDGSDAFGFGNGQDGFDEIEGRLQLEEREVGPAESGAEAFGFVWRPSEICAAGDDDGVLSVGVDSDGSRSGGSVLRGTDLRDVYTAGGEMGAKAVAEEVVSDLADHGDLCAKARGCEGLVCAFTAGEHLEVGGEDGLAGNWDLWRSQDEVHVQTADDHDEGHALRRLD